MKYGVDFWVINKGQKTVARKNAPCFSSIWNKEQDAIRYMIFPSYDCGLTQEMLDFYFAFVGRMLSLPGCAKWKLRKLKENRYLLRLETKGLHYKVVLFHLTWFRYVEEMPKFPIILFERKEEGDTDEDLFRKFQQIHHESLAGKIAQCYTNSNHGLIYYDNYGSRSCKEPITIARLVENIKNKPKTVFEYFS